MGEAGVLAHRRLHPFKDRRAIPDLYPLFTDARFGKSLQTATNLQRVTFRFSVDTEVHYVVALPKAGDLVAHGRQLWVVVRVVEDSAGAVAICELSPNGR